MQGDFRTFSLFQRTRQEICDKRFLATSSLQWCMDLQELALGKSIKTLARQGLRTDQVRFGFRAKEMFLFSSKSHKVSADNLSREDA